MERYFLALLWEASRLLLVRLVWTLGTTACRMRMGRRVEVRRLCARIFVLDLSSLNCHSWVFDLFNQNDASPPLSLCAPLKMEYATTVVATINHPQAISTCSACLVLLTYWPLNRLCTITPLYRYLPFLVSFPPGLLSNISPHPHTTQAGALDASFQFSPITTACMALQALYGRKYGSYTLLPFSSGSPLASFLSPSSVHPNLACLESWICR